MMSETCEKGPPPPAYSELEGPERGDGDPPAFQVAGCPDEGLPPPDYEAFMTLPDISDLPPPPQYEPPKLEGVMGPHAGGGDPAPALFYADFLPGIAVMGDGRSSPIFQDFKTVMTIVNDWLRKQSHLTVIRVEDLERRMDTRTWRMETETTISVDSWTGSTQCIRGVRLWLVPSVGGSPPQQLWYMNVVPKGVPIPVLTYTRRHEHFIHGMHDGMHGGILGPILYFPDFENLDKTLEKLNNKLQEVPLPGRLLSVTSYTVKYSKAWDKSFDPDLCFWERGLSYNKLHLTVLRLFFVQGPPEPVTLGIKDFVPEVIRHAGVMAKPQLEKFDAVVRKGSFWMQQQKGFRFTNVQTVQSKVEHMSFLRETSIDSSCMHDISGFAEAVHCQTLRIYYITGPNPALTLQNSLTIRDFCPVKLGRTSADPTSAVISRMNNWLQHTRARVVGVDTLAAPFTPGWKFRTRTEDSRSVTTPLSTHCWITYIRLYLDGSYPEPPPEVRPITPPTSEQYNSESECCVIL